MKKAKILLFSLSFILTSSFFSNNALAGAPPRASVGILNSTELNPQKTGYKDMDNKVEVLLTEFRKTSTDTYSLVKACYDCLIHNTSLRSMKYGGDLAGMGYLKNDRDSNYNSLIPRFIVDDAAGPFYEGKGVCDEYSAAFIVMTRAIGLESYLYSGKTAAAGGGYTGHAWVEININGTYYIFDPNIESHVIKARGGSGGIGYYYFCKTEEEMKDSYIWDKERIEETKKEFTVKPPPKNLPIPRGAVAYVEYTFRIAGTKTAATPNSPEKINSVLVNVNGKSYTALRQAKSEMNNTEYMFIEQALAQIEFDPQKNEIAITIDRPSQTIGLTVRPRNG